MAATTQAVGRFGRYAVLEEIAAGGMAIVHLGRVMSRTVAESETNKRLVPGTFVAVKRMHAQFSRDPDFRSMFVDEARVCARIKHENVVATLDDVETEGELLLILELIEGESLARLAKQAIAQKKRTPASIVSACVVDMLRGLHAAHEAVSETGEPLQIVHRDVSPHNVLVSTDGVARVLDFGVAKARGRMQQTLQGQLKGKLAYMSPEQARGKEVDRRSDVFASGIVLWELLLGKRLFDGENEASVLSQILMETPKALSHYEPSLASIDPIVAKAFETDPEKRFATALEMAEVVAEEIPPASREEVAAWLKTEAKGSLERRKALIVKHTRAQNLTQTELAAPSAAALAAATPPAPPPAPAAPDTEDDGPASEPPTRLRTPEEQAAQLAGAGSPLPPPVALSAPRPLGPRSTQLTGGKLAPLPPPSIPPRPSMKPTGTIPSMPPASLDGTMPIESPSMSRGDLSPFGPALPPISGPISGPLSSGPLSSGLREPTPLPDGSLPDSGSYKSNPRMRETGSGTSSVSIATRDLPPPLPADRIKQLATLGAVTAMLVGLSFAALLVIFSKQPWSDDLQVLARAPAMQSCIVSSRALLVPPPPPAPPPAPEPSVDPGATATASVPAPPPPPAPAPAPAPRPITIGSQPKPGTASPPRPPTTSTTSRPPTSPTTSKPPSKPPTR